MPKPTSRDFAYSTGAAPAGSSKVGNIVIGKPTNGVAGTGMPWYGGPDEDKGYVLALSTLSPNWVTAVNRPTINSNLGFERSLLKTEASFLNLVNGKYNQSHVVGEKASTYLRTLGVWDSYSGNGGATSGLFLDLNVSYRDSYSGTGTVWADLSGNFNNANLINGPAYQTNNGFKFYLDGSDDRAQTSIGELGNNATYEAVIYSRGNLNTYNMFIGQYLPYIGFYNGNSIVYSDYINGTQTYFTAADGDLITGKWYHIVCTREYDLGDNSTTMIIYVNGGYVGDMAATGQRTSFYSPNTITVGDGVAFTWYPFKGDIYAARVYNRAINPSEVLQNYNFYLPRMYTENGLQFYVDGDNLSSYNGTGTTWTDISSNATNVTNANMQISKNGRYSLFSGTTASTPNTTLLNTDTHTVELLIMFKSTATYPNGWTGGWEKFFSYNGGGSDRSPGVWRFPTQRLIHWQYAPNYNGPNFGKNGSNEEFDLDTYYHIVVTKNGGAVTTYINGEITNEVVASNPKSSGTAEVIFFEYYTSDLMEIQLCRIYDRPITEKEAWENYLTVQNRILI